MADRVVIFNRCVCALLCINCPRAPAMSVLRQVSPLGVRAKAAPNLALAQVRCSFKLCWTSNRSALAGICKRTACSSSAT